VAGAPIARAWRRRWARGRRGSSWPRGSACERELVRDAGASTPRWRGAAPPIATACSASSAHSDATAVAVTGPCAPAIAAAVGARARVLGPPEQMALFAS
jgi:hypothetical protein